MFLFVCLPGNRVGRQERAAVFEVRYQLQQSTAALSQRDSDHSEQTGASFEA